MPWRWLIVALVGGAVCTVCDHLHVTTGVLYYPRVSYWGQAWWVPLLFIGASVLLVAGATPLRLLGLDLGPRPTARVIAGDSIALVTAYAFTAFGSTQPWLVAAVLAAWWLARITRSRPRWVILYSLLVAAGGTFFEAGFSALGAFHYHPQHHFVLGVPIWLPTLYLHVGLLAAPLHIFIAKEQAREGRTIPARA